ncbi:mucin-2-like isoform X4 [Macrobrachium nipponense]|uniref:mucin-2-like isoform X4 n=1 Tax=Macrobrachium nipponense TaxID=159736 RepID=UPI0030C7FDBD
MPSSMDGAESSKDPPSRRRSMVCLRVIPQDIVARKRSLFLDAPIDFGDLKQAALNGLDSSSSDCSSLDFLSRRPRKGAFVQGNSNTNGPPPGGGRSLLTAEENEGGPSSSSFFSETESLSGYNASSETESCDQRKRWSYGRPTAVGGRGGREALAAALRPISVEDAHDDSSKSDVELSVEVSKVLPATNVSRDQVPRFYASTVKTWSAEPQPVEPLHHGESPTLNPGQTHFKVEGGPKRSPGDGDEGPLLLTTSHDHQPISDRLQVTSHDHQPISDRLEVPSVADMRPITGRGVGGVYSGKSSEQHQECLCKPRGTGSISTPSPSWAGRAIHLSPFYSQPRSLDANINTTSNASVSSNSSSKSQQTAAVQGQAGGVGMGVKVPAGSSGLPMGYSPHLQQQHQQQQGEKKMAPPTSSSSTSSPTRRQSLPEGPRHSKELLYDDSPSGLTCTCPHGNTTGSTSSSSSTFTKRRPPHRDDLLLLPKLSLSRDSRGYIRQDDHDDGGGGGGGISSKPKASSSSGSSSRYRRSISLGQILQASEESPYANGYSRPCGRTSYPGSTEPSPADEGGGGAAGRELSDFEKENLLFLKDLDNSYHRPLTQSLSNTSLGSTYSEDSLTGDSTPRGGSPYPGRREYPRTAYSPSKTSPSKIIRSISREEPEDDLSEGDTSQDERRRKEVVMGRKTSLPILASRAGGSTSDSSAPSSLSSLQGAPAWWNSKPVKEPPPRKYSDNSISPSPSFIQAKMVFSHRSLSSPGGDTSRIPPGESTSRIPTASGFLQEPPWRKSKGGVASTAAAAGVTSDSMDALQDIERKSSVNQDSKISPSATTTTTSSATAGGPIPDDPTTGRSLLLSGEKPRNGFIPSTGGAPTNNEGSSLSSSVSSSSAPAGAPSHQQQQNEDCAESNQEVNSSSASLEPKKPSPMAFTIELGGGGPGQSDAPKKLDITASISKWAPKHRRNLSLTKVEEHKKVEERVGKPPVGRPRSGTIGATGLFQGRRAGGYHSEGYFSSDQDDETPRRTADLKSPRSPRTPELRSPQTPQRLVRSTSQDSAKGASLKMRTPSPDSSSRASHTMTLNESASYLIEKMMSGTPETQRKQPGKTEGRTCCKAEKKPTVAEVTGRTKSEKGSKIATKMTPEARKQSTSANSLSSCQTYDVKLGLGNEPGKEEKDDVSEAGTYTIEKDSSSPEVEQARNDIDRVFGVSGTESEAEITPRGNVPSEEPFTTTPEADKFKSPSSLSRNSPNWIQQWAAQVAEHTKTPDSSKTLIGSPRGSKPTLTSLSSSQESSESRPRRKLPTPPTHHHHLPYGMTSPRASDISDHESPTKGRLLRDLYDSPTPPPPLGPPQSDPYGRDTESLLRDTEQLVTSLQARMDMKTCGGGGIRGSSFESHDSGGDSDLDTSTSYPINEDDDRLMKTFGAQQKTKLKLGGIEGGVSSSSSRTPPVSASPRKGAGGDSFLGLDSSTTSSSSVSRLNKLGGHFKRERSIVSDSGYDIYSASREGGGEQCLQSDSSSEASEPLKDSRKATDNNPPLKFNRAFSLRRARLGCDETATATTTTTTPSKSSLPVEKKKLAQSPSVGNVPGTRKPLSSSKSHQSTRGDSQSQTSASKSGGANDFSRGDGGRFSLRLARSGSTNTVSKSPSHSSVRKELSNGIRRAAPRSNSTLSAKEVDFQNWKRRKNYDPMKAAAEGRKKLVEKKNEKNTQGNGRNSSAMRSPSPPGSLLRSASFHGTEGMGMSGRWPRKNSHLTMSEDDGPYSLEEEVRRSCQPQLVPHCSPLRRSPTSPHQLASPHITSPARQATIASVRARRSSYTHSDEGEGPASPSRKPSLDESGSEGKRSPLGSTRGAVSGRSKAKMEALDNLVISTIHSLSVKVRTTSETLLQKLKSQYDEEGDRAALLEEVLAHLSESDPTLSTSQSRSTSRELAGILRNLKKIEHALEVIDRVLVGVDDDDLDDDDDDLDGTVANEWGESDY